MRSVRSRSTFSIRVHTQFRLRKFTVDSAVYALKIRAPCPGRSLFLPQMRLDEIWPPEKTTLCCMDAVVRKVSRLDSSASRLLIRPIENWPTRFFVADIVRRDENESGTPLSMFQRFSSGSRP